PLGTTTDTCTATDQAGHSASCSFTVTVAPGKRCPLGEGFWKEHTDLWAVSSLKLGDVTYTRPQLAVMKGIAPRECNNRTSAVSCSPNSFGRVYERHDTRCA